ncbi:MAG: hypothetical protein AB8G16_19555 [Gammaproteobacteria bacterium]
MRSVILRTVAIAALMTSPVWAHADGHSAKSEAVTHSQRTLVPLNDVLDVVGKRNQRRFTVELRVQNGVELGRISLKDMDYSDLLHVLARNDLASFESGDITHIIPVTNVRNHPIPVVNGDEANLHDAQWVTYVMSTGQRKAVQLLPLLRPMLPQSAHMSPHQDPNFLIVVDRWQNVERIKAVVAALQTPANAD